MVVVTSGGYLEVVIDSFRDWWWSYMAVVTSDGHWWLLRLEVVISG